LRTHKPYLIPHQEEDDDGEQDGFGDLEVRHTQLQQEAVLAADP
jgi:hypothetical protein